MRFVVVILAVLAVACAQSQSSSTAKPSVFNNFGFPQQNQNYRYNNRYQYNQYPGQYQPYQNQYQGQYQGQYQNQYQPYQYQNQYRKPYQQYKPFVSSTTAAPSRPVETVSASASASIAAPAAVESPAPVPVAPVPVVAAKLVSDPRSASIVKYGNEINPDGAFNYFFETDNGIAAQAQGTPRNFGGNPPVAPDVIQGAFSWVAPQGEAIGITYVADENGYQPQGDAIPQPPEIPAQIARALEYIAKYTASQK